MKCKLVITLLLLSTLLTGCAVTDTITSSITASSTTSSETHTEKLLRDWIFVYYTPDGEKTVLLLTQIDDIVISNPNGANYVSVYLKSGATLNIVTTGTLKKFLIG